jgi:ABC-type transport system involved in cytochrome c biogenesis ATPase subunit
VSEEIAFGPLQMGWTRSKVEGRIGDVLEMLGIADLADRAPYQLSGGEKKRVAIASVLVMNPEVILFDEPTAALDPRTQQRLVELIAELGRGGKTIVWRPTTSTCSMWSPSAVWCSPKPIRSWRRRRPMNSCPTSSSSGPSTSSEPRSGRR